MLYKEILASFWDDRVGYVETQCGQNAGCLEFNLAVSILTIGV